MQIDLKTRYTLIPLQSNPVLPAPVDANSKYSSFSIPPKQLSLTQFQASEVPAPVPLDGVKKTELLHLFDLTTKGLLQLQGDRMTYIISNPGEPRPTSFESIPGDFYTKVTLRRVRTTGNQNQR